MAAGHAAMGRGPSIALFCLVTGFTACTGSISDGIHAGNAPGDKGGPPGAAPALPPAGNNPFEPDRSNPTCAVIEPGPAPLRRLTRTELDNTIRDLVGQDLAVAKTLPPEELHDSFDNNAQIRSVSDLLAEGYTGAAEQIAKTVVAGLPAMLGCDPVKDGEATCLDRFLDGLGKRLWRRPLTPVERDDMKKAFAAGKTSTFAEGLDAVVQVMALSPQFLYRLETGVPVTGASYGRLSHWEMASRLSYLFWGTMPDAHLFAAAEAGQLGTRDQVMSQALRLIDDPRATAMITNFGEQWLQLRDLPQSDKDPTAYPRYTDDLLVLWQQEADAFLAQTWKSDHKLDTWLTAPYSMMNAKLAAFYGVSGPRGDAFEKVMLDPTDRAGVLSQGGLMAVKSGPDQTSPVQRGVFVREQMLCQPLPPPPPEVNAMPPMLDAKMTTKERFAAHRADPSCASCHSLIDNLGFGFEALDAIGLVRTTENGKPVDPSGTFQNTDVDGPFAGVVEMSKKLASSKQVESCMATHLFNFSFGREKEPGDQCTTSTLSTLFAKSGGDVRQLLLALTQTDAFFFKGGLQ
jgi:hypothetical protein